MNFKQQYGKYKSLVDDYLRKMIKEQAPHSLYDPLQYVLSAGGKRIRPLLVLLSCESVGGSARDALHAGAGIEILHNFTLVHDDIMDNADARRGRPTVHTKWDANVAILAGDALLGLAYRALLRTRSPRIREISRVFTEGLVEVCEGQAYDKEFETLSDVEVEDYLLMIRKKTGKLIAVATEVGALIGGGSMREIKALRNYGEHVGRAFQIQDDLLDIIADEKEFGKSIGGDLVEGKKTFLLLEALERATGRDKALLLSVIRNGGASRRKVGEFRRIYDETGAIAAARRRVQRDIVHAKKELQSLPPSEANDMLMWVADMLLNRTF